jgi:tight adherence protein B
MVLALLVFLIGAGAVFGGYAAMTHLPAILARRQLDQRLHDVSAKFGDDDADSTVLKESTAGPLPGVDRAMSNTRVGSWLARLIEQSGTRTTPSGIGLIMLVLAAALAFVTSAFVHVPVPFVPLGAGVLGALMPLGWLKHRRTVRLKRFEEQFPEALDLLSRAIRAGHAFQTAMGMVADEMDKPVGPEFKKTFEEQNFGLPLRDALNSLSERVHILDVRFFVTAVLIQRDTGGNLSEILDNLAHVVRERFKIRRQVRTHTAHGRFTGYVLLALPAALAVALSYISPEHMETLFTDHMGQMMIMGAIVMQTVGFIWIRQIIKIEV